MAPAQGPSRIDDEVAHFQSIPWCARHLASRPDLVVTPVFSRSPKPGAEDALLSQALKTHETVRAFVCFFPAGDNNSSSSSNSDQTTKTEPDTRLLPEVGVLVSLGTLVSGYDGVAHGGVVALLFDEALSLVHPGSRWRRDASAGPVGVVTAYLNTGYLRPVPTPGEYLIRVTLKKAEGRKVFVEAVMEDERGEKLARADALFIESREKL